jgi:hypothetical protein
MKWVKWGKDFWVVLSVTLLLMCILQQALMGSAMKKLESKITEIEAMAQQNYGWVYIELEKDK